MTKTFSKDTLLSIDGFIYLVDREAELPPKNSWIVNTENPDLPTVYKATGLWGKYATRHLIIATNNPSLEGVAKIGELGSIGQYEEVMNKWVGETLFGINKCRNDKEGMRALISSLWGIAYGEGYKAASSKKEYTEDNMLAFAKEFQARYAMEQVGSPEAIIYEFTNTLKPVPIFVEIEYEYEFKNTPDQQQWQEMEHSEKMEYAVVTVPKLKDGYVIIKEVRYDT